MRSSVAYWLTRAFNRVAANDDVNALRQPVESQQKALGRTEAGNDRLDSFQHSGPDANPLSDQEIADIPGILSPGREAIVH